MARQATVSRKALRKLAESRKPLTAKEMGVSAVVASYLRRTGQIVVASELHTDKRGRPAFQHKLTPETRKRLRTEQRRAKKAEKAAA